MCYICSFPTRKQVEFFPLLSTITCYYCEGIYFERIKLHSCNTCPIYCYVERGSIFDVILFTLCPIYRYVNNLLALTLNLTS